MKYLFGIAILIWIAVGLYRHDMNKEAAFRERLTHATGEQAIELLEQAGRYREANQIYQEMAQDAAKRKQEVPSLAELLDKLER